MAIQELTTSLKGVASQSRGDSRFILEYIWGSVRTLIIEINRGSRRLRAIKDNVGDVARLRELHEVHDVTDGVVEALERALAVGDRPEVQEALRGIDHLTEWLCGEIDADHRDATTYALKKINEVVVRVASLESALPRSAPGGSTSEGLSMATIVNDSTGSPAFTIGESSCTQVSLSSEPPTRLWSLGLLA